MTLVATPDNPIPDGAIDGKISTPDGLALRFARWSSLGGSKGTVCIFQGRTEFIEKYFEVINELRQRGFAVATMDWRGQGHSARQLPDPRKGYVRDFADFEADADAFVRQVVLPNCPRPYFALAHSMGGGATVRVAHSGKQPFERYVFSSPMIDLTGFGGLWPARLLARALRLAGRGDQYVPGGNGDLHEAFQGNKLTTDPRRFARNDAILTADPTLGIGSATITWVNAAYDTIDQFQTAGYAERIAQPALFFSASEDTIVSKQAIERFAGRLPKGLHRRIEGARHEVLQEQDHLRKEFWAEFDKFMA